MERHGVVGVAVSFSRQAFNSSCALIEYGVEGSGSDKAGFVGKRGQACSGIGEVVAQPVALSASVSSSISIGLGAAVGFFECGIFDSLEADRFVLGGVDDFQRVAQPVALQAVGLEPCQIPGAPGTQRSADEQRHGVARGGAHSSHPARFSACSVARSQHRFPRGESSITSAGVQSKVTCSAHMALAVVTRALARVMA